ncbi:RNA polymerase sigma factor [Chelativorans sp. AA-79]|uniref:RNA polymerase sigma factor n=1 Tax=Chelativorans sp. AA-79 TaxID=3028735 RepID=UPI0023F63824|nr:RNA polymerase sigma factor [Chelativorans sp. AA-79]WEX08516.1 RNA polymerase sigma factor [Chelativorans sp. AA-79]
MLVEYASQRLGSRDAAEDIVQEAFIRFVPATLDSTPHRLKAYLFRIVHNLVVDVIRRRRLEIDTLQNDPTHHWMGSQPEPTPEETVLFCEAIRRSMDAVANLPENQRVALEMVRFGGYSVEQVSEHLGVSVSTVYRLVQNAVATITIQLTQDTADPLPSQPRK